jgi:micrococcal nuclease
MKKTKLFFLILLFSLLTQITHAYQCVVEKVYDGDTFLCSGEKIRLIGIDTPESSLNPHIEKQRSLGDTKTILELGRRAKKFTQSLIPVGTKVEIELDVQPKDKYGRVLAYVWLPDGRMLNEVIVREGYAMLLTIPPNVRYEERLRKAYRYAVENGKGLWGELENQSQLESSYRAQIQGFSCPPDRPIKGNINRRGERIYHVPGGAFYDRTKPERCFATEEEAQREGFRRARR